MAGRKLWLNGYLRTEHRGTVLIQADRNCEGVNVAKGVHDVGKRSVALTSARTTHGSTDGHCISDIGQLLWLITRW